MYKEGWDGEVMHPHQNTGLPPFFVKFLDFVLIVFLAGNDHRRSIFFF